MKQVSLGLNLSTKNVEGKPDPEMHQTKKCNQWYFGMKAHIGVDADSGLVHSVEGTAANVNDLQAHKLLHGEEADAFADAGDQGAHKRPEAKRGVNWHVAMRPGERNALDLNSPTQAITDKIELVEASVRAKIEHPFGCSRSSSAMGRFATEGWPRTHRTAQDLVHAQRPVHGAGQTDGWRGMSAPKSRPQRILQGLSTT